MRDNPGRSGVPKFPATTDANRGKVLAGLVDDRATRSRTRTVAGRVASGDLALDTPAMPHGSTDFEDFASFPRSRAIAASAGRGWGSRSAPRRSATL